MILNTHLFSFLHFNSNTKKYVLIYFMDSRKFNSKFIISKVNKNITKTLNKKRFDKTLYML